MSSSNVGNSIFQSTRRPPGEATPVIPVTAPPSVVPPLYCDRITVAYTIVPAIICGICFIFGILYCFFGYRFFKATMFMTGFVFGSLLTYLICLEEQLLPLGGKIGVALTAGVLCGLITMLVQYVGLFMTGLNLGLLLAVAGLVITEFFYHLDSRWLCIGVLFGIGLLFALLTLYFQRGLTIAGTSMFGAALMSVALDYFVEMGAMMYYVWDRVKALPYTRVCWFSWLILGLWPLALIVGMAAQWRITGKGFDHHDTVHSRRRKKKTPHVERAPRPRERREPPPPPAATNRYRHLYQVRRVNGDVISRNCVQNIQHHLSPAIRSYTKVQTTDTEGVTAALSTDTPTTVTPVPC